MCLVVPANVSAYEQQFQLKNNITGLKVVSHIITLQNNWLHGINEDLNICVEVPVSLPHYLNHISSFFWQGVLREIRIHQCHSISLVYRLLQLRHLAESNRTASGFKSAAANKDGPSRAPQHIHSNDMQAD